MRLIKIIASAGIVLVLASVKTQAEPASAPGPRAATAASNTPAVPPAIKPVKKRFLLSRSSAVYQQPDSTSAVVTHVKRRTHVDVIGIAGDWLQIKLRSGKIGFIPTNAAE
jgi:hypothetical protein